MQLGNTKRKYQITVRIDGIEVFFEVEGFITSYKVVPSETATVSFRGFDDYSMAEITDS